MTYLAGRGRGEERVSDGHGMTSGKGGEAMEQRNCNLTSEPCYAVIEEAISGTLYNRELSNNSNLTANPWNVEIKKAI
jgi:hypothetical protein